MGTRSLTYVYNDTYNDEKPIVCMYRQFDGYPSGHGIELAKFLNNGRLVNGLGSTDNHRVFNGMGCLAAQIVANFKKVAGNIYLHVPRLDQDCWQEYEYHVYVNTVVVKNPTEVIFKGGWQEFYQFCSSEEMV